MTKKGLDRMQSKTVCTARRRNGTQCLNYAIKGASVCRMHGGSAPQVRAAAQVRLLMQADNLMAALLKIALDDKQPVAARLIAIRDGLDRANLAATQNIELTVEKGKTFEDFVGEAIVDVALDDDSNVIDVEVVDEAPTPVVPEGNRHDRAAFAEVERTRSIERRQRPGTMTEAQRRDAERAALAEADADAAHDRADFNARYEAEMLARAGGNYNPSSRGRAAREAAEDGRKRRARSSDATNTDGAGDRPRR